MRASPFQLQRRLALALGSAWAVSLPPPAVSAAEAPTGWVRPRLPAPMFRITGADGRQGPLTSALSGKVTAVQLMFTGCSVTCPIQGALFALLASRLGSTDAQLLSISIDTLGDTPATLSAWQSRFGQHPTWHAAVADATDVDQLGDFLKGKAAKSGTHTAQVFLLDRQARLCYRTGDSPGVAEVQALVEAVARLA